ncbi:MAG: bifunctional methionine sulfoxide reductase B/A protein [Bacteroidota bacterium]
MNYKKLTPDEESIIINKGTERPFTGKYYDFYEKGTYVCKQCGTPLYKSTAKFHSGCGWPSFDDEIKGAIDYRLDADGQRTEIMCAKCGGHLGHVFEGEGLTQKNTRHCVNSISMDFIPDSSGSVVTDTAIFAGGCFWGVEYYFQKAKGVVSTEVGYIGGHTINPTYKEVCLHTTGHVEAIRVIFNTKETDFETLAKLFFEIHDPTQSNGQGPDIGEQYLSEVFYNSEKQKEITLMLIEILKNNGFRVVTKVRSATEFWVAEDYHQQYYEKNGHAPYCHAYKKRF